jgi:solute carrier family 13 (sodium-dependent dicarboxylate transporter), member 2/3/5
VGLVLGGVLFFLILLLPAPAGLDATAWRVAAVGALMATWWVSEAIPIPATALLPLVLFPLLGVADIRAAAEPFANPIIYLFLGGFLIARSMQATGLPRRLALSTIRFLGARPRSIVAGVMASCAFLSMWVSNTATALMMLPIGLSLVALMPGGDDEMRPALPGEEGDREDERRRFGTALMLGIAYSCSIGGMGTLIGTPPNAFLAGFMLESYGVTIGFARWMLLGVPLVLVGLPLCYLLLTRIAFPIGTGELPGGRELLDREARALGPMSRAEKRVAAVFACTAVAWVARPVLTEHIAGLSGLSDAGIAMTAALVLFLSPSGAPGGRRLLDWKLARDTPWGVLILFGGGLSLAGAVEASNLGGWLGTSVGGLSSLPLPVLVLAIVTAVILLTELTSNTATAATFLPVLGGVAIGLGRDPLLLAVPAALAASGAFMLPVATPPNAIVYGSGVVRMTDMVRAGVWLVALFAFLVTAATYLLLPLVFGVR